QITGISFKDCVRESCELSDASGIADPTMELGSHKKPNRELDGRVKTLGKEVWEGESQQKKLLGYMDLKHDHMTSLRWQPRVGWSSTLSQYHDAIAQEKIFFNNTITQMHCDRDRTKF
ncbi:hypothetical protein HAX54_003125, partial [Datura stramonium]|nr:hypothetical protein [Datura stramonium]